MKFFDLKGNEISKEKFVEKYSILYTSENIKWVREILANDNFTPVNKTVEKVAYVALNKEIPYITADLNQEEKQERIWKLIAWKAGRLEYQVEPFSDDEWLFVSKDRHYAWNGENGMRSKIGKKRNEENLTETDRKKRIFAYIDKICKQLDYDAMNSQSDECLRLFHYVKDHNLFISDYLNLLDCECANIGTVYMITLLFFFSKGKYPIYDRFAHVAAKAIYLNAYPDDIYVGDAPEKTKISQTIRLYNEYCWLLKQIFGDYEITREQDQALWVYGHACIKKAKSDYSLDYKVIDFE